MIHKEKSIPTILGLIMLIVSIFGGIYLTSQKTYLTPKASDDCQPINPQYTNITFNSFDVSFTSSIGCISTIVVNNQPYKNYFKDQESKTHYFSVNNLKDNQEYKMVIVSGDKKYSKDEYKIKTAIKPSASLPDSNMAWGNAYSKDGSSPATGSIIYINIPGASPLSSIVNSQGYWNISLSTSFNESKTDWFSAPKDTNYDITVFSPDGTVTQLTNNTSNNNPVPDIIIGQNSLRPRDNIVVPLPTNNYQEKNYSEFDTPYFSASASATPISQISPTLTPIIIDLSPTEIIITPTEIPNNIPTKVVTEIDKSGNTLPTQLIISSSLILFLVSILVFIK